MSKYDNICSLLSSALSINDTIVYSRKCTVKSILESNSIYRYYDCGQKRYEWIKKDY
jgi:hypothetical protein